MPVVRERGCHASEAVGPSDRAGLYECAVLQACILQLRRKARIVAIYGPDEANPQACKAC